MRKKLYLVMFFVVANFNLLHSDITIDGKGDNWDLLSKGSLTIPTGSKLTLKRTTVNKLSSSRLVVHHSLSQLVLQNSTLSLDGNYSFTQGSLVIKGDCTITGTTGTLFTFHGHNILIDYGATLKVKNITFQAAPTARNRQLVKFGNETSQFLLEDATFKANNAPTGLLRSGGLVMVGGNLVIEGSSIIDNSSTASMHALQLGNAGYSSSNCRLVVRPNSKLTVKNAGVVFKNVGSGSLDLSGGRGILDIDSTTNANFLIETPVNLANSTFNFDFSMLKGLPGNIFYSIGVLTAGAIFNADRMRALSWTPDGRYYAVGGCEGTANYTHGVYSFDGSSTTTLINCLSQHGHEVLDLSWSPDGKYLALGGYGYIGINAFTNRIYSFANNTTTTLSGCNFHVLPGKDSEANSVAWSPDGRYLASAGVGGTITDPKVRIYSFDGSVTSTLVSWTPGANVYSLSWSPDGKYLATGGYQSFFNSYTHHVYSFDGSSVMELSGCNKDHGDDVYSVSWSPDGKYLAIGGKEVVAGGITHRVYSFDGNSLTLVESIEEGQPWNLAWSPDGKYLAVSGQGAFVSADFWVYSFDGSNLSYIDGIDPFLFTDAIAWYPDGRYLGVASDVDVIASYTNHRIHPLRFTSSLALAQFQNATLNLGGGTFKLNDVELRGS